MIAKCKWCGNPMLLPREGVRIEKTDGTRYFICAKCFDEKCGIKREEKNNGH